MTTKSGGQIAKAKTERKNRHVEQADRQADRCDRPEPARDVGRNHATAHR